MNKNKPEWLIQYEQEINQPVPDSQKLRISLFLEKLSITERYYLLQVIEEVNLDEMNKKSGNTLTEKWFPRFTQVLKE